MDIGIIPDLYFYMGPFILICLVSYTKKPRMCEAFYYFIGII